MSAGKVILLAVMAVATMATPISASAAEWTHEGEPLEEKASVELTGNMGFTITGIASYECITHMSATLEPGSTGTITKFETTATTCKGSGALANCKAIGTHVLGLSWSKHAQLGPSLLNLTDVTYTITYEKTPQCPIADATRYVGSIIGVPDGTVTVRTLSLSGTGTDGSEYFGTLSVLPEATFGFE